VPSFLIAENGDGLLLEDGSLSPLPPLPSFWPAYLLNLTPITITPTVLPNATNGGPYAQQLVATEANGSGAIGPYAFTVVAGALPVGLTLSTAGLISGTVVNQPETVTWTPPTIPEGVVDALYPTTTIAVAVTIPQPLATFTVRATDVSIATDTLIAENGDGLLLEDGSGHYLVTSQLGAYAQQAYTLTIVPNWISPIQYTCSPRVPACLNFSATGVLAGTPMQVRASGPWTVTATDANGRTQSYTYTLTVRPSP
jgi:hypothetical protein